MSLPPRNISFSLLFFKSLSGLGVGIIGMIILLIFVLFGLGTATTGAVSGPFLVFSSLVMGFITAMVTSSLGVFIFGMLDRERYPDLRLVVKHVILLNVIIFIFLLPIYFFTIIGADSGLKSLFLIAALQLLISAQASIFVLEFSANSSTRENLITIYGTVFGILSAILATLLIYSIFQNFSTPEELAVGGSGGKGPTAALFAILPLTWFCFGFFISTVEMVYRWVYETWGVDFLNKPSA
jgi:hypothetical protein